FAQRGIPASDKARAKQRVSSTSQVVRSASQDRFEPAAPFRVASEEPERPETPSQSHGRLWSGFDGPGEGESKIRVLLLQTIEPGPGRGPPQLRLGSLGQRQTPVTVSIAKETGLSGLEELVAGVGPNRFEESKALGLALTLKHDERFVDEAAQEVED